MWLTNNTLAQAISKCLNRSNLITDHFTDRNTCPVGDHLSDSLLINIRLHQRCITLNTTQFSGKRLQLSFKRIGIAV